MSLRPGTATTITREKGQSSTLSGIGTVDKVITKDPPTPLEYGRQHLSPANIGTVS
jgi:hypothetical protein